MASEAIKLASRKVIEFMEQRLSLAEHARNLYQATVEPGVQREDLQDPSFWAHVSKKFEPGTMIEVVPDDFGFFCKLFVVDCGSNWASVKELQYVDMTLCDIRRGDDISDGFEVAFKGSHVKWCVIRKEDKAIIKKEMGSESEAIKAMNQHVAVITR